MVLEQFLLNAILLALLHVLHYGADLVLHALKADVVVEFREYLVFGLGNEALGSVDILGLDGFAAAEFGFYVDVFRHLFGKMAVCVAKIGLAHIPGEVGVQLGRKVAGDFRVVFFF